MTIELSIRLQGNRLAGLKRNHFAFNILENCRRLERWRERNTLTGVPSIAETEGRHMAVDRQFTKMQLVQAMQFANTPDDIFVVARLSAAGGKLNQQEIAALIEGKETGVWRAALSIFARQVHYLSDGAWKLAEIAVKSPHTSPKDLAFISCRRYYGGLWNIAFANLDSTRKIGRATIQKLEVAAKEVVDRGYSDRTRFFNEQI